MKDRFVCYLAVVACCAVGGVATNVRAAEPPPIVWDLRAKTGANTAVTITLEGLDVANESMTFSIATKPTRGSVGTIVSKGTNRATVVYTPNSGFTGLDSFTYRAKDVSSLQSHAATVVVLVDMAAEPGGLAPYQPKDPLKTASVLYTPEQIAAARELCKTHPQAIALLKIETDASAYWLEKTDEQLRKTLPDWRVARAFNDSVNGCPVHGKEVFQHGTYPWIVKREDPYRIYCPVGGEAYPSNDFGAYYESDFKDHKLLTGKYVDPGRGWLAPDGEKRWMVAHAVHQNWRLTWLPAITNLSHAYTLTGEKKYAQKAIAMLDRVAEIYPNMIHSLQSRYAELQNGAYRGKIINAIWETGVLKQLAVAYDLVFPALVSSDPVSLPWRTSEQIRRNIEANLLEEGIAAVGRREILGNFGMHQSAIMYAASVRQSTQMQNLVDKLVSSTGGAVADEGIDYAFYNFVRKDGIPYENGFGYSFLWVNSFAELTHPFSLAGKNLYEFSKYRAMLSSPLDLIAIDEFTPSAGDSGSITTGVALPSSRAYRLAFRALKTPEMAYGWWKAAGKKLKEYESFDDLFFPSEAAEAEALLKGYSRRPQTRFLDGYGIAFMNNRSNTIGASLFYGPWGSHYHFDRLNVEVFGKSTRLSPDLGYPDFMNAYVPGIYTWSTNTISHNTLLVDDQKQNTNLDVPIYRVYRGKQLHVLDTLNGTNRTYSQCDRYRRTLALREISKDEGYFVDVFRVRGGKKSYNLSFHGNEGAFSLNGATLPPPVTTGTLAGSNVELGQIYDDPVLGAPGYNGSYAGYKGSGFQHFFNWQKVAPNNVVVADWKLLKPADTHFRLHILPDEKQEVIVADAYVSPTQKIPTILKYVLLRRVPSPQGDVFVTVWEPTSKEPIIDSVEQVSDPSFGSNVDRTVGVKVKRRDGVTDTLLMAYMDHDQYSLGDIASTDAATLLISEKDGDGSVVAAGGTNVTYRGKKIDLLGTLHGDIQQVDYLARKITVVGDGLSANDLEDWSIRIYNGVPHSAMYWVGDAEMVGDKLNISLTGSDVLTGRMKLTGVNAAAGTVTTTSRLIGTGGLVGAFLINKQYKSPTKIVSVASSGSVFTITVDNKSALANYAVGDDAWLSDIGPGNVIQVERVYDPWEPPSDEDPDAGADGGTLPDGAAVDVAGDGGSGLDARGHDGAWPSADGSDGGFDESDDGGCACAVRDNGSRGMMKWMVLLAGAAAMMRRRRHSN